MKRTLPWAALVVLLAVTVVACNMGVGAMPEKLGVEETDEETAVPKEPSSGARVIIPKVSNRLLEELNASYEPASGSLEAKAIMFATTVELELYQAGELQDGWTLSDDLGLTDTEDGPVFTEFLAIGAGIDYTMEATIINNKVNTDPMIFAQSAPFTILPGISTDVYMLGVPVQYSEMTMDGQSYNVPLAQAPYEFDPGGDEITLSGIGGETWFEFSYTGSDDEFARIRAEPASDGDAVMLIYDDDGAATEGMMDPPPMSWGMFDGGPAGTRAAFMGPLEPGVPIVSYLGGALLNRFDDPSSQNVTYFLDILDRPAPAAPYTNVIDRKSVV